MSTTHSPVQATGYSSGFTTLETERVVDSLPVEGAIPDWLDGTLVRNGPAVFDSTRRSVRHWFDGMAMLHNFTFHAGAVSYRNRILDTPEARAFRDEGRIAYGEFATDPCASLFGRFFTRFRKPPKPTPNASVNVARMGERTVALTETPIPVEFDPDTLETVGVVEHNDDIGGVSSTAHPHADPGTGDLVNFTLAFGRRSEYRIYRQHGDEPRRLVAAVPSDKPGYLHSFAITERHVVLMIFPLSVNPLSFLLRSRPFIENYRWRPQQKTRIVVVDTEDGSVSADTTTEPCFGFHHINAYDDGDTVVMDLAAYPDARVVDALYIERLRAEEPTPVPHPTRFTVDLPSGRVRARQLSPEPMELPTVAYRQRNGRPYRYCYGVGASDATGANFLDQLVKLDVQTGGHDVWHADHCYPGEPVFVPAPAATGEDEGVVLSVVLDASDGTSFLLVLDAATWTELARARAPHAIPFGFHGQFSRSGRGRQAT